MSADPAGRPLRGSLRVPSVHHGLTSSSFSKTVAALPRSRRRLGPVQRPIHSKTARIGRYAPLRVQEGDASKNLARLRRQDE